jgi:hypothetical protein
MKILSIDIGIKNLAYCLFDKPQDSQHFRIKKWDVVDISEQEIHTCCFFDNNIKCDKPAKFKKDEQCFCLKHSKKQQLQIPTVEQKRSFINKQKVQKLFEIADNHSIKYDNKIKKADLINLINDHINKNYFETVESKNASDVDLFNIGINIKTKFNTLFEGEGQIDYVIIENQISPIATRMKTIQGMIVQYFIMSNLKVDNIEFISASNKLKDCDAKEKKTYSDRKKLGVAKCLGTLTNDFRFNEQIDFFNAHKKKDDLSDSFLQGMWFLNNKLAGNTM